MVLQIIFSYLGVGLLIKNTFRPDGTVVNNTASIYFDYNTPVVTNVAATLIQSVIANQAPVANNLQQGNDVIVNNPANDILTIKVNASSLINTNADIYNSQGGFVKSTVLLTGTQTIDVSNLSSGAYYLKTQTGTLKIIIVR